MQGNFRLITILYVLLAAATVAASPRIHYPKPPLPDRPAVHPSPLAAQPDCAGATPVALVPGDSLTFTGDTTGGASLVDGYACNAWDESGPEAVYELTGTETLRLHATLAATADLDLFLLSDCDSDACVAAHISEFAAEIPAGTWYLVVDGYDGAEGAYELTLEAEAGGLPQAACEGAETVTTFETRQGNVLDRPDLMPFHECAAYIECGGEAWYLLTVPPSTELTVTVQEQPFDAALWLFEDCAEDPVCVDFTDAALSGEPEQLVIVNDLGTPWELVLGVDSFRPVSSAQGDTSFDGAFDLVFDLVVSNERATTGGLKTLFR